MKTHIQIVAAIAISLLSGLSSDVNAQSSCSGNVHQHRIGHYGYHHRYRSPAYGYGFRPVGYDYRYGTAELLRASATANVLNSQARALNAQTVQVEMENSVQFLATRLERKRINHESRFGHLAERKELARMQRINQAVLVASSAPKPVVDPRSGAVEWPLLLRMSHYAKARSPIDSVFHARHLHGSINPDHFLPMRDLIERIQDELKSNIAHYEMEDYLDAQAFLRQLLEEARIDLA